MGGERVLPLCVNGERLKGGSLKLECRRWGGCPSSLARHADGSVKADGHFLLHRQ